MQREADIEWENAAPFWNVAFTVRGDVTPIIPARLGTLPDRCYESEGGEVEEINIELLWAWEGLMEAPVPLGSRMTAYWEWRIEQEILKGGALYSKVVADLTAAV